MPEKLVMLVFLRLALLAIISLPEGSQRRKHEKAKHGNNATFHILLMVQQDTYSRISQLIEFGKNKVLHRW